MYIPSPLEVMRAGRALVRPGFSSQERLAMVALSVIGANPRVRLFEQNAGPVLHGSDSGGAVVRAVVMEKGKPLTVMVTATETMYTPADELENNPHPPKPPGWVGLNQRPDKVAMAVEHVVRASFARELKNGPR